MCITRGCHFCGAYAIHFTFEVFSVQKPHSIPAAFLFLKTCSHMHTATNHAINHLASQSSNQLHVHLSCDQGVWPYAYVYLSNSLWTCSESSQSEHYYLVSY